jgi:hypothetical protein
MITAWGGAPAGGRSRAGGTSGGRGARGRSAAGAAAAEGTDVVREWRCGCGAHNYSHKEHCRKCDTERQPNCSWRKPEWVCACGKKNYCDRQDCRECGQVRRGNDEGWLGAAPTTRAARGAAKAAATPAPAQGLNKVKKVEAQVDTLVQLGVAQATIDAVKAEVAEARRLQVSAKPLGARMDSATARVKRAKKLVATANTLVDDALVFQEDALAEEAGAVTGLAALAAEAARADARPAAQ